MNVLLLSRYSRSGNSSRVRSYQYLPFLRREGIEVTEAPLSGDRFVANLYAGKPRDWGAVARSYLRRIYTLLGARRFDLLWIEREVLPYAPALAEFVLTRIGGSYVIDYDDAVFHNYDLHPNPLVRLVLASKIDRLMQRAKLVIVGNEYLAERSQRAGARWVELLPSAVDTDQLRPSQREENARFRIGWIGTPPNARYLDPIRPALENMISRGRAELILIGSGQFTLSDGPVTVRPWNESREAEDIGSFDAGIMPLPDTPFERGKCGYKLLQYFACGIPAVASPVGANRTIIEHGTNGFLAEGVNEWFQALESLRDSPGQRLSMGKAGREKVERDYSVAVSSPKLAALLRKAAGA